MDLKYWLNFRLMHSLTRVSGSYQFRAAALPIYLKELLQAWRRVYNC